MCDQPIGSVSKRKCSQCGKLKPLSEFHRHKERKCGLKCHCKDCEKLRSRRKYLKDPGYNVRRLEARFTPEERRKYARGFVLKRQYGMTYAQFEELFVKQHGKCSLCHLPMVMNGKRGENTAVVDHCHQTGRVRGLLHRDCNRFLGRIERNLDLVVAAQRYLKRVNK